MILEKKTLLQLEAVTDLKALILHDLCLQESYNVHTARVKRKVFWVQLSTSFYTTEDNIITDWCTNIPQQRDRNTSGACDWSIITKPCLLSLLLRRGGMIILILFRCICPILQVPMWRPFRVCRNAGSLLLDDCSWGVIKHWTKPPVEAKSASHSSSRIRGGIVSAQYILSL